MLSKANRVIDEETRRQVQNSRLDKLEANNFGRTEVPAYLFTFHLYSEESCL